ncbi:hypothetical protein QR680_019307 [Steinernema hermaphroditum]|uniref:Uncharacterized protein n=1 Tax=Steinernema hermaphroditum TaxID=289476 RepID=A0AA39GMZ4_9BILA|nr:hypothetical protein QR680_019307 [Steinernema hermaphroditum]
MLREEVFVYNIARVPHKQFQYWNRRKRALFWQDDHLGIVNQPFIFLSVIFCGTEIVSYEPSHMRHRMDNKMRARKVSDQVVVPPYYSDSLRVDGVVGSEKFGLVKVLREEVKMELLKHVGCVVLCTVKAQDEIFHREHGLIFEVREVKCKLGVYNLSEEMNRLMPWNKYAGKVNPETGHLDFLYMPTGTNMYQPNNDPKYIKSSRQFWECVADVTYDPFVIEHMKEDHEELVTILRRYEPSLAPL